MNPVKKTIQEISKKMNVEKVLEIDDVEIKNEFKQRLDSKVDQIYEIGFTSATEYLTVSSLK